MIGTNSNNLNKYLEDSVVHITKVQYVDSPYAVDSLGFGVEYYNDSAGIGSLNFLNKDLAFRGNSNILSYDWSYGVPPGINTQFFKMRSFGFFYAEFTGIYTFYLSKDPTNHGNFYFDDTTSSSVLPTGLISSHLIIDEWNGSAEETASATVSLTAGNWYPWRLDYANSEDNAYLCLRYLEPDGALNSSNYPSDNDTLAVYHLEAVSHKKVLSAGVTNYKSSWTDATEAEFETKQYIYNVESVSLNHSIDKSSEASFVIPIVDETDSGGGFIFDPNENTYKDPVNGLVLRHGRKIEISCGYQTNCFYNGVTKCDHYDTAVVTGHWDFPVPDGALCSGLNVKCPGNTPLASDYVKSFTGIIKAFDISRQAEDNTITVICQDPILFALEDINENYPNQVSYAQFDFTDSNVAGEPNGQSRPTAYDSWPMKDAVRDLLIKANIDPTLLYGRRQILDRNGNLVYGNYLIQDDNILLRRNPKYGNPLVGGPTDDEYIWAFDYGDKIHENIASIADLYGYAFRSTVDGLIEYSPVNAPKVYYHNNPDINNFYPWENTGGWSPVADVRADGGRYFECNSEGHELSLRVTGSKFVVNVIRQQVDLDEATIGEWNSINQISYGPATPVGWVPFVNYTYSATTSGIADAIIFARFDATMDDFDAKTLRIYHEKSFSQVDNKRSDARIKLEIVQVNDATINSLTSEQVYTYYDGLTGDDSYVTMNITSMPEQDGRDSNAYFDIDLSSLSYVISGGETYGIRFQFEDTDATNVPVGNDVWWNAYTMKASWYEKGDGRTNYVRRYRKTNQDDQYESDKDRDGITVPDFSIISAEAYGGEDDQSPKCKIEIFETSDEITPLVTATIPNIYRGYQLHSNNLRYPEDGIDFTGRNPCQVEIPAYLLQSATVGGAKQSYGSYKIVISQEGGLPTVSTRVTSVYVYESDNKNILYPFDTVDNIQDINANSAIDDLRNDVIVIGTKKGEVEDINGEVINKNNPTFDYIYSRATDANSIYNPKAENNCGRKRPFIIYEPRVVDQKHADWLSLAVLQKYSKYAKTPSWTSKGIPSIDVNDPVYITDERMGSVSNSEFQWITSRSDSIQPGDFSMTFNSTPYEPWPSYVPKPRPNPKDFDYKPFINIVMTNNAGEYTEDNRFDVYGVETSGNRLRVKYDQVVNGFVTLKVIKDNDGSSSNPVAYLIGGVENGIEVPEYREKGFDYEIYWDCTDETSASRINYVIPSGESWRYIDNFKTEPGLYATSGDYYLEFSIDPILEAGNNPERIESPIITKSLSKKYNPSGYSLADPGVDADPYAQYWYINWGEPISCSFTVNKPVNNDDVIEYEDVTYPYMNTWGNSTPSLVDPNGIKVQFSFENDDPRLLYFNIDAQLIHGTSMTTPELNANTYKYAYAMWQCYSIAKNGTDGNGKFKEWHKIKYLEDEDSDFIDTVVEWIKPFINASILDPIQWNAVEGTYDDDHVTYNEIIKQFSIDSDNEDSRNKFTFMDSKASFDPDNLKISFWSSDCMPYQNAEIKDYKEPFARKVKSNTDVHFFFNPSTFVQSQIDFNSVPLLTDPIKADQIKQAFATMIWFSVVSKKQTEGALWTGLLEGDDMPKINLGLYYQLLMRTWDKTGRFVNSDQDIIRGQLDHDHEYFGRAKSAKSDQFTKYSTSISTQSNITHPSTFYPELKLIYGISDSIANTYSENGGLNYHRWYYSDSQDPLKNGDFGMFYKKDITYIDQVWGSTSHVHASSLDYVWMPKAAFQFGLPQDTILNEEAYNDLGGMLTQNLSEDYGADTTYWYLFKNWQQYNMTIGDTDEYNWGIGLCNTDKLNGPHGAFSWHGYMEFENQDHDYLAEIDIPFDIRNIPNTDHWIKYDKDISWKANSQWSMAEYRENKDRIYQSWKLMASKQFYNLMENTTRPDGSNWSDVFSSEVKDYLYENYVKHFDETDQEHFPTENNPEDWHVHIPIHETMTFHKKGWDLYDRVLQNRGEILKVYNYDIFFAHSLLENYINYPFTLVDSLKEQAQSSQIKSKCWYQPEKLNNQTLYVTAHLYDSEFYSDYFDLVDGLGKNWGI